MVYTSEYASPLGTITLACDESAVIGLWFSGQKYFESTLPEQTCREEHPLLAEAKRWLDVYFSGREPDFLPPLRYDATPFRRLICDIMLTIPYGKTMTYGAIAAEAAGRLGVEKMSAQAVGGAVGHNPISLLIPCHRVVGTGGSLTGYGGGIWRKVKLLELEQADMTGLGCSCRKRARRFDGGGLPTKQNRLRQADEIGLYNRKKVGFPSVSVHRDIF